MTVIVKDETGNILYSFNAEEAIKIVDALEYAREWAIASNVDERS